VLDDLLTSLVGEAVFGRLRQTPRSQLIARLFFGALGTALGVAGAVYVPSTVRTSNAALTASMTALFVSLACFFLFNVTLARPWRWPALCFAASLVLMFVTRIVGGP
jgi:hypothetical protein